MNYWIIAVLSWIFTALYGTFSVNIICNHIREVKAQAVASAMRINTINTRHGFAWEWFVTRVVAVMLVSLTLTGLVCLMFSAVKLIGG